MRESPLVIITTELPPAMCGIGTYSWLLREHSPNESSRIEFLVHKNEGGEQTTPAGDRVTAFDGDGRKLAAALDRVGTANVLLHYAGRAYQRFGCPWWMPGVLAKWKRKFAGSHIMIVVHELPALFPMSSRHFWLGKINEQIVARLSRVADVLVTNSAHHVRRLREITRRNDVHLLPTSSNIEMASATMAPRSRTEFVLFGLQFGRLQTLQLFHAHIRGWHAEGLLTKLHLVGPTEGEFARQADELIDPAIFTRHGRLPSAGIAALLRRVSFALTNASEETWSKSTTFMACVANECPIVVAAPRSGAGPFAYTIGADEVTNISEAELVRRTQAFAEWYRATADWPIVARQLEEFWPNERSIG